MSTAVLELTEATFDPEITDSPLPVVVEFWAQWCPFQEPPPPGSTTPAQTRTPRSSPRRRTTW